MRRYAPLLVAVILAACGGGGNAVSSQGAAAPTPYLAPYPSVLTQEDVSGVAGWPPAIINIVLTGGDRCDYTPTVTPSPTPRPSGRNQHPAPLPTPYPQMGAPQFSVTTAYKPGGPHIPLRKSGDQPATVAGAQSAYAVPAKFGVSDVIAIAAAPTPLVVMVSNIYPPPDRAPGLNQGQLEQLAALVIANINRRVPASG